MLLPFSSTVPTTGHEACHPPDGRRRPSHYTDGGSQENIRPTDEPDNAYPNHRRHDSSERQSTYLDPLESLSRVPQAGMVFWVEKITFAGSPQVQHVVHHLEKKAAGTPTMPSELNSFELRTSIHTFCPMIYPR